MINRTKNKYILIQLSCFFCLVSTFSQVAEKLQLTELGLPYHRLYSSSEYRAHGQNWGMVQDSLGVLYFANGFGVLTYDGVHWQTLTLPNNAHTKSITIDENDRIYVGASNEMGYLAPNSLGGNQYVSLVEKIPEKYRNFGTVWTSVATNGKVYFKTDKGILCWNGNQFNIWEDPEGDFRFCFLVNGYVYVYSKTRGLLYFDEYQLKQKIPVETIENTTIKVILPYDDESLLLVGYEGSLYRLTNNKLVKFKTEIDDFFLQNKLYSGLRLNDGSFAFGTLTNGLVVIDKEGRLLFRLDNTSAETAIKVLNLFQDSSGILWACLNDGILKLEYPSAFTVFDKKRGINSRVQIIKRHMDELLVGTANGLFILEKDDSTKINTFRPYHEFRSKIWDIANFDDILLIADEDAVFEVKGNRSTKIEDFNPSAFLRSKLDSNRVFISLSDGIRSIYFKNGSWIDEGKIAGIEGSAYTIVETVSGDLWLETSQDWVWRLTFKTLEDAKKLVMPKISKLGTDHGLPGTWGNLYYFEGHIYFSSGEGKTYRFSEESYRFQIAENLNQKFGLDKEDIYLNHVDEYNNLWFDSFRDSVQTRWGHFSEGEVVKNLKASRILKDIGGSYTLFYEARDSVLWLTGNHSVIRQDLKVKERREKDFNTIIGNVIYKKDSVLKDGFYKNITKSLPHTYNSFRFSYSATSYFEEDKTEYQYYLKGFDQTWSEWTSETKVDYTNIPEGDYEFHVRAKNFLGQYGKEDTYFFEILPPWYRTWWAYSFYLLGGVLLLWAVSQWRSKQLRSKNLALEAVVAERTHEIREKNKMLGYQTERLKELDTMKTRLFANISHEFRTPLTLIKGPVEKLEAQGKTHISMPNIKMIRRNANRLLNLVNQLLDLSKLDSGRLNINATEGDVFKSVRTSASAFSSHAASRKMDYQINVPSELLWVSFDRDKLEKVLYNLLGNAFKFTKDEGVVHLKAMFRNNRLKLHISDTGSGIPTEKLPHIFDRFYQVDESYTREKAGSGIGLALTKELVELMGGTIFVESEVGLGTKFKVVIPFERIETGSNKEVKNQEKSRLVPIDVLEPKATVAKGSGSMVLVIEDNNDMRFFIREQLEDQYHVLEAANGQEGLDRAQNEMPELIITDLMMPQMDGITLCKELKSHRATSHIPVIMLTAKAGIENKLEGLETGADDYLTKPFNAKELQVRTKNLIGQRARLRELYARSLSLDPKAVSVNSVDEEFLEEVLTLMEENYADASFGPVQLQKALTMSKTQLHRKLKALTNTPPSELLRNFRLKRAAQLLPQRNENISQVAYDVGFNSLSYFTKCFRDLYGMSPTRYVKQQRD